ncbi:hypothetical protein ASPZODRAFT_18953 [Penicilliopsis zonata CBS 506.65]|uniref:ubiquitinyl hydrolase 1 n=1 Tax=Penicilliopsis zonata CBS 506.65 TaxID=1073090 RepID=A0A1L9SAM2_9EURO|nr:hypothetical protein ASPZODRAFT_18953 [Penicilliopsis zonata CBS 506.65]OJJ44186.1 hypothetical protein ASPZODRAFT_18953 [Penicilliopsis zonata CBS 506.65]
MRQRNMNNGPAAGRMAFSKINCPDSLSRMTLKYKFISQETVIDSLIEEWWTTNNLPVDAPTHGIKNGGDQCYRNSVLVMLLHTPVFVNWLNSHNGGGCDPKKCLVCLFKKLASVYWSSGCDQGTRTRWMNKLWTPFYARWCAKGTIPRRGQQDATEFLVDLLNYLEETDPVLAQSLSQIFQVRTNRYKFCDKCKGPLVSMGPPDSWYWLSALLTSGGQTVVSTTLKRALRETMAPRPLDNETCSKCGIKLSSKGLLDDETPEVLLVCLDRIKFANGSCIKIETPVKDFDLDLNPYLDNVAVRQSQRKTVKYELYAAICHIGKQIMSGHYITYVKNGKGKIQKVNDLTVTPGPESFGACAKLPVDAYLLAYRKVGWEIEDAKPTQQLAGKDQGEAQKSATKNESQQRIHAEACRYKVSEGDTHGLIMEQVQPDPQHAEKGVYFELKIHAEISDELIDQVVTAVDKVKEMKKKRKLDETEQPEGKPSPKRTRTQKSKVDPKPKLGRRKAAAKSNKTAGPKTTKKEDPKVARPARKKRKRDDDDGEYVDGSKTTQKTGGRSLRPRKRK